MEEPEALLKHLGLTEYEAKAILVVLKNGKCTAETVSNTGGIPLPRVYDTMSGLAERGLVLISKTRPQTFRAVEPKKLFDLLKESEKKKTEEKIRVIESVEPQFINISKDMLKGNLGSSLEDEIALVKKRINVDDILSEIYKKTRRELLIFAGDMSWLKKRNKEIRNSIKKKVVVKILSNEPSKETIKLANMASKLGVEVKFFNEKNLIRGFVSDIKTVCLIKKQKEYKENEYFSVIITNEMIGEVFKNYFYLLWNRSTPLGKMGVRFKKFMNNV